jgi:protein involved in polysaccharide export with SLBB domain
MIRNILLAGLAATLLSGCAARSLPPGDAVAMQSAYLLGAGDKIRITTFGFKDLGGDFVVAADGSIALPLIGGIKVVGLTPAQLEQSISSKLQSGGFVRDPRVGAEVTEYRPYYIYGEVAKPGQYPFTNGLTVVKAVATAQGFTYRANKRSIFIIRDDAGVEVSTLLTAATPLHPGDTVRVAERYF